MRLGREGGGGGEDRGNGRGQERGVRSTISARWCCFVPLLLSLLLLAPTARATPDPDVSETKEKVESPAGPSEGSIESPPKQANYRLPTAFNPLHYFVRLQPFLQGNFSIHGYTEITFQAVQNTSQVVLHIKDIVTKNETLKIYELEDPQNQTLRVVSQTYNSASEFYTISLEDALQEGKKYVMQLEFVGYLNDKLYGFYRSSYTDAKGNKRWQATTQFQATDARRAFPCFDEPAMKAEFTVELLRQEGLSSISNMPLLETTPVDGQNGWFADKFEKSVKMSTYLIAFLVSDFKFVSTETPTGTLVRVWAKEESIHQADYAVRMGKEILVFFENFFNISYPLPKLDMVAVPDFGAGAMENWGLVLYRETLLLYDAEQSAFSSKKRIGSIISHELAHQWFGNLVTPHWWTDSWLNEGFATFLDYVAHDAVEPDFRIKERFLTEKIQEAMNTDALESSHPISMEVEHTDEISPTIMYSKGASIIRMMNHFLTEDTLRKGLTNYLNEFAYSDVTQDDLWHFLTLQAESDQTLPPNVTVKEIMDTWTLLTGFPVISVTLNGDQTATLTQERFFTNRKENSTYKEADSTWWVPITFTSEVDPDFSSTYPQQWMKPSESNTTVAGIPPGEGWLIFNVLQTGFYRVNYDEDNWNKLTHQLIKNHSVIHSSNRVQIIGDAFQLAKAELLPYTIPLSLILYIGNETENIPLLTALFEMGYIENVLKESPIHDSFQAFFLALLTPHYGEVGFHEQDEDTLMTKEKRVHILSLLCYFEYAPCVERAKLLYHDWMLNPSNKSIISPNLRTAVICTALREGGNEEWDFAWSQYQSEDVATEKIKLLYCLGYTRNVTKKMNLLDLTFQTDGPIRSQDSSTSFSSVIRDKESRLLAWNYLKENWDAIYTYLGNKRVAIGLINRATSDITTDEELSERDEFIASKSELDTKAGRSLIEGREKIVANINWLRNNLQTMAAWLK